MVVGLMWMVVVGELGCCDRDWRYVVGLVDESQIWSLEGEA